MAKTTQVAALPWRQGATGVEILLVTTRTTKRWVIPKGWTMEGKADHEAAAIEAYEEAGVHGAVDALPLGDYGYLKILQSGRARHVNVKVFMLAVGEVLENWPEKTQRQRQWVSPEQALTVIGEPELRPVIIAFAKGHGIKLSSPSARVGILAALKTWWRKVFS